MKPVGTRPMAYSCPPMPPILSRPWFLSDSRRKAATPSFLKKAFRARLNRCVGEFSSAACDGGGSVAWLTIGERGASHGPGRLAGSVVMTMAPFSLPLYFCSSSVLCALTYTTGPRTTPAVPGDQPAEASVSGCSAGLRMRPRAVPRRQARAMVHASRCTFDRPYLRNISAVQRLAWAMRSVPVSRGPIMSERYSRLAISSLLSFTSARIPRSVAATGPSLDGSSCARARQPHSPSAIITARRKILRRFTGSFLRKLKIAARALDSMPSGLVWAVPHRLQLFGYDSWTRRNRGRLPQYLFSRERNCVRRRRFHEANGSLETRSDRDARRRQDHPGIRNLFPAQEGGPQRRAGHRGGAPLPLSGE